MSVEEVYIDVPAVRDMSTNFQTISDVLNAVCTFLEGLIMTLNAAAFMGLVGARAAANFFESIKPDIEKAAEKCAELSQDLTTSVDAYERADQLGATKFY